MSITILRLGCEQGSKTAAHIRHGEHEFAALVHGKKAALEKLLNQESLTEMTFERVAAWKELEAFDDAQSCIRSSSEVLGAATVRGRVHNTIELKDGTCLVDLYLQTGPEFMAISSRELDGHVPSVGMGLEVTVHGLCFHPAGAQGSTG